MIEQKTVIEEELPSMSLLNNYLYMTGEQNSNGLLTIKRIMELPDSSFLQTRYVVLSACNTGVIFAPKTLKSERTLTDFDQSENVEEELRKVDWVPDIGQASFIDAFVRRKVNNVYEAL